MCLRYHCVKYRKEAEDMSTNKKTIKMKEHNTEIEDPFFLKENLA